MSPRPKFSRTSGKVNICRAGRLIVLINIFVFLLMYLFWLERKTPLSNVVSDSRTKHGLSCPNEWSKIQAPDKCNGEYTVVKVLFVHLQGAKGNVVEDYLIYALLFALESGNQVALLYDGYLSLPKKFENFESKGMFMHRRIYLQGNDTLTETSKVFGSKYRHRSTNAYEFELISFQRFFIMEQFMKEEGLPSIMYVDSDVTLLADISKYTACRDRCDVIVSTPSEYPFNPTSAHTSFWKLEGLAEFNTFLLNYYSNTERIAELDNIWEKYKVRIEEEGMKGGICDMTLLGLFLKQNHDRTNISRRFEICNSYLDNSVLIDHKCSFRDDDNFHQDTHGRPYLSTGTSDVPLISMHFQGNCKEDLIDCGSKLLRLH